MLMEDYICPLNTKTGKNDSPKNYLVYFLLQCLLARTLVL
jgi:hypothetical protein